MPSVSMHPAPAWSEVAREQIRAVGLVLRREAVLFALLGLALSALIIGSYLRGVVHPDGYAGISFDPEAAGPIVLLAFLVGSSVWRGDEPSRRSYLWSLPVDRTRHTLTKTTAGWVWLMALLVVYTLVVLALALITGGEIGQGSASTYIGEREPGGTPDPSLWREVTWSIAAWEWVVPFVAVTIAYLIGSIAAILSDYPWRWLLGITLGFWLTIVALQLGGMAPVANKMFMLVAGDYGLFAALTGEGPVIYEFTWPDGVAVEKEIFRSVLSVWLPAAALWLGLAGGAVLAAARVHQER